MFQRSKGTGHHYREKRHNLVGGRPESNGWSNLGPRSERRDALVPSFLAGFGDNDVNPSHMPSCDEGFGDNGCRRNSQTVVEDTANSGDEEATGNVPDEEHG